MVWRNKNYCQRILSNTFDWSSYFCKWDSQVVDNWNIVRWDASSFKTNALLIHADFSFNILIWPLKCLSKYLGMLSNKLWPSCTLKLRENSRISPPCSRLYGNAACIVARSSPALWRSIYPHWTEDAGTFNSWLAWLIIELLILRRSLGSPMLGRARLVGRKTSRPALFDVIVRYTPVWRTLEKLTINSKLCTSAGNGSLHLHSCRCTETKRARKGTETSIAWKRRAN